MFEDTKITIFKTVAEERSFTKAARKLGISQPAVSQNIAELEKNLGTALFVRNRNMVELTDEGRRFTEYASQINYWYNAASEAFSKGLPGSLARKEKKKDIYIGMDDSFRCHIVPEGTAGVDINVSGHDGGLSIRIEQKKTDTEMESALVLF